jgi:hypothetical protein
MRCGTDIRVRAAKQEQPLARNIRRLGTASLTIIRRVRGAVGIEKALQNQHGSDLVDDLAVAGEGASGSVEMAVGFGGGEALVPQVDGQGEGSAEVFGEGVGFRGLGANVPGHIERIAQDDGGAAEFAEKAAEGFKVLLRIFADEGEYGLGGEAEFIGDSDADAAIAEIEAQEAGLHSIDSSGESSGERRESRILQWVRESKRHHPRDGLSASCDAFFF